MKKGFTLVELVLVIGILAILFTVTLIAINPARQLNQANDTKRMHDLYLISDAINQYMADNQGALPTNIPSPGAQSQKIASGNGNADLCSVLIPRYTAALPQDPSQNNGAKIKDCSSYDTGYIIAQVSNKRLTLSAPKAALTPISITR